MILQLGWRNIWRNKLRTSVILTAVVIGVWAMIFLGALMRGISDRMVRNGISTLTAHIQIQAPDYRRDPVIENRITDPAPVMAALENLPETANWAPRVRVNCIANNARHSAGATLVAIDPDREARVSFIKNAVIQGRYLNENELHGIIVGKALLEKFETQLGHKLVLMSQDVSGDISSRAFRIVGVYQAELESTEKQFLFVTLTAGREMLGLEKDISQAAILLSSHDRAEPVAQKLKKLLQGQDVVVRTWEEMLPMVTAVLKMYDGFIFFWFLAVFVAMGFGLVNTILMAVFERVREFGLFRALGLKPWQVVAEVLSESFFLLLFGTLAGNLLSLLSILALSKTGIDLSAFAKGMEFAGMSRVIFPVLHLKDLLISNVTVFFLGLLVSLYPAIKASRFSPVDAMAKN